MKHELMFRAGTWDRDIWTAVSDGDEYRFGEYRFNPYRNGCVIDVGAHVGGFTYECLRRGATRVVAVEADEENLYYLRHNLYMALGAVDRVVLLGAAVTGGLGNTVHFPELRHANTGGRGVSGRHTDPKGDVDARAAVPMTAVIDLACAGGSPCLVKLDCEGSEWSIMDGLTVGADVNVGKRVLNWVGEYHLGSPLARGRGPGDLAELFGKLDCSCRTEPTGDGIGLFWAWRNFLPQWLGSRSE